MLERMKLHQRLVEMRTAALANPAMRGPRVLICGKTDVGKSTLCETLIAWHLRTTQVQNNEMRNAGILFADIDVGQNGITAPGSIGAQVYENYILRDGAFTFDGVCVPTCLWFGSPSPKDSLNRIIRLEKSLGTLCLKKLDSNPYRLLPYRFISITIIFICKQLKPLD